jgi:hypothetical protein
MIIIRLHKLKDPGPDDPPTPDYDAASFLGHNYKVGLKIREQK